MSTEKPSREVQELFEQAVDDATHDAIESFEWMGLPDGDQRGALLASLNDAIAAVMRDWL